jgi:hypothetical protein
VRRLSERYIVIVEPIYLILAAQVFRTRSHRCALKFGVIPFRFEVITSIFEKSQQFSSFDILGGEFFRVPADTRIGMFQEPVEGLSFLSADDAFPGDATLEVSQSLPVLQLGSSEPGAILTQMVRMTGSREFLIRAHSPAAPTKMAMSLVLFCHNYFSFKVE